jgi:hypothetical protein
LEKMHGAQPSIAGPCGKPSSSVCSCLTCVSEQLNPTLLLFLVIRAGYMILICRCLPMPRGSLLLRPTSPAATRPRVISFLRS